MNSSSPSVPSVRGFQSLVISIVLLLVLVADPRLFLSHIPHAGDVGGIVRGLRLWLVCLTVCFTLNRLMEMVLKRTIRHAWVYIASWSIVVPLIYGIVSPWVARRWPGQDEDDLLLLTAMLVILAFAGTMFKRLADSVSRTAHYDHLTGLPNRVLLTECLDRGIERSRRLGKKMAVCMVNIDYFKRINDSLGHAGGDALLIHAARQLQKVTGPLDTVARISGDEFVVLMPDFDNVAEAEQRGQRILDALNEPTMVGDLEVCVTASLGFCLFPDGAQDSAGLLHSADAAMYEAKNAGRASVHIYTPATPRQTTDRLELEEDFRYALENNELSMHYQPQIQLATCDVTGVEALLRWNSPKRGNVPPSQFIAIAEEVGLMIPVGEWALQQICRDGVEMQKATGRPLTVALNLSARQFGQRGLVELVEKNLVASGLNPRNLELEITEQMLMVNSPHTLATLQAIRDLGVGIAIDDFGTGFSSFSYILQYHVDRIKIDQSFIARSIEDPNATAVVRTIIAMAHGLNMRVVAEGVETIEQSDFLLWRRCDDAQGYLFARPMPKAEVPAAVERIVAELRQRAAEQTVDLAASEFGLPQSSRTFINN
jgi:diguanylate cyclase (GGDEF)-like protein